MFDVKKAAENTDVMFFLDAREYLSKIYGELKSKLENYSYRKFSEDLGFGYTNYMHLIIQGHRPLSSKAALRIAEGLGLKSIEKQYFLTLAEYQTAKKPITRDALFGQLVSLKSKSLSSGMDRDQLEYFSEWYHPVVREVVSLPEFNSDPSWVAARIFPRITQDQALRSLQLLERIGYITFDEQKGRYYPSQTHVRTAPEVRNIAVVRYHQKMIELGKEAITQIEKSRRDIGAVTLTVNDALATELKAEMQKFRRFIVQKSEDCKNPDQVYQVNIQFFPFTTKEG